MPLDIVTGGALSATALIAYPLWYSFRAAQHVTPLNETRFDRADLLGAILPTSNEALAPAHFQSIANGFAGYPAENGTYLGIPLVLIMVAAAVVCRRSKVAVFAMIMAMLTYLFSLGSHLLVGNHNTGIGLPGVLPSAVGLINLPPAGPILSVRGALRTILLALCVEPRVRVVPPPAPPPTCGCGPQAPASSPQLP